MVNPQDIYAIVSALALGLGAIGGIPQIRRWFTAKPSLKIIEMDVQRKEEASRYLLRMKVLNEVKWHIRKGDATEVRADMFIMNRNNEQWGSIQGILLSPFLFAGATIPKETPFVQNFKPGEPYTIILVVYCAQGVWTREKITYQI